MKIFVDNTTIHRIYKVICASNLGEPIRSTDAVALLHFGEHIMFAENMEFSAAEDDLTSETSNKAVELLKKIGCIELSNGLFLLEPYSFKQKEYQDACITAAPKIQSSLAALDEVALRDIATRVDEAAKPSGLDSSVMERWLTKDWSLEERESLKNAGFDEKKVGSDFDITIASNQILYDQLKQLTKKIHKIGNLTQIARSIEIFFRLEINRALSSQRSAIYSPAPKRANALYKTDAIFRHAIARRIENHILESRGQFSSSLLDSIIQYEALPLPIFAIHYLKQRKRNRVAS